MGAIEKRKVATIETKYLKEVERNRANVSLQRKYLKRRLVAFMLVALPVLYILVSTVISQTTTIEQMETKQKDLTEQLEGLKDQETELKDEIVKLNDDDYIAKLARKEFFLSGKNEIIFSLPNE